MGIALFILSFACICGMWYITGRNSIYNKLKADYREALNLIGFQQAIMKPTNVNTNQKKRRKKMENKINIAEILRNCPKGTKLYSPLFGKCEYITVANNEYPIAIKAQRTDGAISKFLMKDGRYFDGYEDEECLLFPSAKMRCWDKFFKRGDIVYNPHSQMYAVFECWANGDYTEFNTTINYYKDHTFGKEEVCDTECFVKANGEQKTLFIAAAEKYYSGKYNPKTLQVEPVKVTEPKCSFEPFQEVLVRDSDASIWKAAHFSHYDGEDEYPYITTVNAYKQCVPYDCNEYLLGTTNNPE